MAIELTNKNLSLLFTMLVGPISITLLIISVYLIQPQVEAKLVSNVISALKEHNIKAEVSFSGRDGILEGEVESQKVAKIAQKISLSVFGTRVIRNHLSIRNKKNNVVKIDTFIERPITKKISYIRPKPEKEASNDLPHVVRLVLKDKKKPVFISEVDKIIANMRKKSLSVVHKNTSSHIINSSADNKVLVKIEEKATISKKPNELVIIINDFNLLLNNKNEKATRIKKEKSNTPSVPPQKLDKIDLSSLYFLKGSIILPKKTYPVLNKVSASIKVYSHSYIELIAYANDSDTAYAQGVAIRNYLVTTGIRKNIIHVAGYTMTENQLNKASVKIFAR